MHIITRKRLLEFAIKHPDCKTALESWYRIVKYTKFNSFVELKQNMDPFRFYTYLRAFINDDVVEFDLYP